jgi:hypothetical protein
MAKATTSDVIKLKNVRLSFPEITKPKAFQEGQTPKYQATFLLNPSDKEGAAQIKMLQQEIKAVLTEHYGKDIPKGIKLCLKDNAKEEKEYAGYEGQWFVSTSNTARPGLAGRDPRIPLNAEDIEELFYPGAVVNGTLTLWVQDNQYGKRVNANLRGIQFVKNGERLGGVAPVEAESEFDVIDGLDDDDSGAFLDDDDVPF